MRLQQLYTQIRIQVINGQYALTNDRAQVQAAQASRDFAAQSLDAEQKKYRLGASTTALVLQQQRNLATADNTLIGATGAYAKDRVALGQLLSNLLDKYGISVEEAAAGTVSKAPVVPGLTIPKQPEAPKPISATPTTTPARRPSTPFRPSADPMTPTRRRLHRRGSGSGTTTSTATRSRQAPTQRIGRRSRASTSSHELARARTSKPPASRTA